jgi:hypothetical protein
MDDRTQEWLHRTRQLDRKHALRGGVTPDTLLIKQTSATVVGALAVMAFLIICPLRLKDSPAPSPRIDAGEEKRVVVESITAAAQFVPIVRAVLPQSALPPAPPAGIPVVAPPVSIWRPNEIIGDMTLQKPDELPPPSIPTRNSPNLVTR